MARVEAAHRTSAEATRSLIASARMTPPAFRAAFSRVPAPARDAWLDLVFELDGLPDDDPALPRGCVPYLPCPAEALLRVVEQAGVRQSDVFVDVGAGVGRAAALVHLLTGAGALGLEIQPALVREARALAARLNLPRVSVIEGDAAALAGFMTIGSVFFLYCPFSGERLQKVLADLEPLARARPIRVCCIDLPLPPCAWLSPTVTSTGDLAIYRSVSRGV
jgi:SAM-dependent methyltransferase